MFTYVEIPPPAPLAAIVRCFWFLRGAMPAGAPQAVLPDGRLEIVLHLADPFARVRGDGSAERQENVLAAGQLTRPIQLLGSERADVVGIRFRTAAAALVLREDLGRLTDEVVPLGACTTRLRDRLLDAAGRVRSPADRAAALARVLMRSVRGALDVAAQRFVLACEGSPGARVDESASRFGVSARTLERRVLGATGLSPAMLRRVIRFRRAVSILGRTVPGNLARAASDAGYYDQSHLVREFRALAGVTPSAFLAGADPLAAALSGS